MFGHKRQVPQKRLVFSLTVKHNIVDDYNNPSYRAEYSREQKIYDNLAPGRDFCVKFRKYREDNENNKNNGIANYNDVRNFCEHVINDEVKRELQELIDLPIKEVKVNRTYEGSLIIVFSVLFNIYQFIGGIAGFRDTLKLIENVVERHMKKRLNDEFYTDGYFEVNAHAETDRDYGYMLDELFHFRVKGRGAFPIPTYNSSYRPERDGLFWYLLISNIILLILVGILVWKAVVNMYW